MTCDEALAEAARYMPAFRGDIVAIEMLDGTHRYKIGQEATFRNEEMLYPARYFSGASWAEAVERL